MGAVSNYCAVWTLAMEGTLGKEMEPQKGKVDLNKLIKSGLSKQSDYFVSTSPHPRNDEFERAIDLRFLAVLATTT